MVNKKRQTTVSIFKNIYINKFEGEKLIVSNDMFNFNLGKDSTMADQMFMFATMAGTMAALAAVLFVSRGIRKRATKVSNRGSSFSPSDSQSSKGNGTDKSKKVKRYNSDGTPVYE
jgi:hypothetical protein